MDPRELGVSERAVEARIGVVGGRAPTKSTAAHLFHQTLIATHDLTVTDAADSGAPIPCAGTSPTA